MSFSEFKDMLRDTSVKKALHAGRKAVKQFLASPECPLATPTQRRVFMHACMRNAYSYYENSPEPKKEVVTILLAAPAIMSMDADDIIRDFGDVVCALHAELLGMNKNDELDLSPLAAETAEATFGFIHHYFKGKGILSDHGEIQGVINAMTHMRETNLPNPANRAANERRFDQLRMLAAMPDGLTPN